MKTRLSTIYAHVFPKGLPDALRQLLLFAAAYYLYRIVRGQVDGQAALAFENGRNLIDLERGIHLFFEPAVQRWAVDTGWPIDFANFMYVNAHLVLSVGFLVWLYFRRNDAFYFVRNVFMVAMGLALVLYVVYPTAPPRFFGEWGFSDTVVDFVGQGASQTAGALYNPYAAVPSMHIAFAMMIGIPGLLLVRNRVGKALWAVYPFVVTFVVVATGNHFWMDAALGAAVAALACAAAVYALGRARPEAWAWRGIAA